jgi:AraC-like DNA-binding protein
MTGKLPELLSEVDLCFTRDPNLTLNALAEELGVEAEEIERAINEVGGLSFGEYREDKRMAQALSRLSQEPAAREMTATTVAVYKKRRACLRFVVPGATICYLVHGSKTRRGVFSAPCPVVNLSKSGLAFLTDHPPRAGRRVSLHLRSPATGTELSLEGTVVYARISSQTSYRYRAGITFRPFADKVGCNTRDALMLIVGLEQAFVSKSEPGTRARAGLLRDR